MQVTDEMVWRIVNLDPNYFSEDQARAMLEHVLGAEPELKPVSYEEHMAAQEAMMGRLLQSPPTPPEERYRNFRNNLAAQIYNQVVVIQAPDGDELCTGLVNTPSCKVMAGASFDVADTFIAELKRRDGEGL